MRASAHQLVKRSIRVVKVIICYIDSKKPIQVYLNIEKLSFIEIVVVLWII